MQKPAESSKGAALVAAIRRAGGRRLARGDVIRPIDLFLSDPTGVRAGAKGGGEGQCCLVWRAQAQRGLAGHGAGVGAS